MRSIQTRLMVAFVLLAAVAVAVTGISNYWASKLIVERHVLRPVFAKMQSEILADMDRFFAERESDVRALAQLPSVAALLDLHNGGDAAGENLLKRILETYLAKQSATGPIEQVRIILLNNETWLRVVKGKPVPNESNGAGADQYKGVLERLRSLPEGQILTIRKILKSPSTDDWVIQCGCSLFAQGKRQGVLLVDFDFSVLQGIVRERKLTLGEISDDAYQKLVAAHKGGYAVMLDSTGTVLVHHEQGSEFHPFTDVGQTPSYVALAEAMMKGKSGWSRYETRTSRKIGYYGPYDYPDDPRKDGFRWSVCVAVPIEQYEMQVRELRKSSLMVLAAALLLAVLVAQRVAKTISRPIGRLRDAAERIGGGDLDLNVETQTHDELALLANTLNQMTRDLKRHMADLEATTAAKERIERELQIGREIQQGLLPQAPPQVEGVALHGLCVPAREVGGDFFDYFLTHDGRLAVAIGDVSGKGVSAALFMAAAKTLVRTYGMTNPSPAHTLQQVNEYLCVDNTRCTFVTIFYALYDPSTRVLTYANAGHNPTLLRRNGAVETPFANVRGSVVGVLPEQEFTQAELRLQEKDVLIAYTDGIVEAKSRAGAFYELDRLMALVRDAGAAGAADLGAKILEDVKEFEKGLDQSDDITLVVLAIS